MTKVPGRFTKFSGTFAYDPKDPKSWTAQAEIGPASIDTDFAARDKDLRSARFFDVERCPKMSFKSTRVTDVSGGRAKLLGELTMHCVTKPIALNLEILGLSTDPWGNKHAGFEATATIDRKEWGIDWNKTLDNGGVFVGDRVEIDIDVDGALEKAPKAGAKR